MLKNIVALSLVALAALPIAHAQDARLCGATEAMEEYARENPDYARHLAEMDKRNWLISQDNNLRQQQTQYVIPVVVHIMHDYGASNISRAQVLDAIRVLNLDFNKLNTDTSDVIGAFQPLYANVGMTFRLAQLDPNGNCTEGITRTYTPLTHAADNAVKNMIRWDPSRYLNIWVANTMASGSGGYSYRPCVSPLIDGIVVRHAQFGSIGTSSGNGLSARTLTHEVGHYMNLPHTWGGSNTPGLATNCGIDDGIADTPNTIGVSGQSCNTGANSCGTLNNVQNFMDYANCPKMFTLGQKAVMLDALQLSCRNTLWAQSNLLSTGTNDGFGVSTCAPKADFNALFKRVCEGTSILFSDKSYNAPVTNYIWTFPGGNPATSTDANPTVMYSTPGTYEVTLQVSNAAGTDNLTKTSYIQVVPTTGIVGQFTEGMTDPSFPIDPTDALKDWEIQANSTNTWHRYQTNYGEPTLRIRNNLIGSGVLNSIVSPAIDISGLTSPTLTFDVAYARSSTTANDALKVYFSIDCGRTWSLRFNKNGSGLSTVGSTLMPNFEPADNSDNFWRTETITLTNPLVGASNLRIKFEAVSASGNAIYIDNINLSGLVNGVEQNLPSGTIALYPNPAADMVTLQLSLTKQATISGTLLDVIGREVATIASRNAEAGVLEIPISLEALPSGVYFVRVMDGTTVVTRKLVKE